MEGDDLRKVGEKVGGGGEQVVLQLRGLDQGVSRRELPANDYR